MAVQAEKQSDKPFHVIVERNNALHSGHSTMEQAEAKARECNKKAEDLGIGTRYIAIPKG